jgi:hypothetical protein
MLLAIIKLLKSFKQAKKGVSNVIVVMLSLILIVMIVSNVILWSYQMNQLDWEKMQENIEITNAERTTRSSWFTSRNEYTINKGSHINGTYTDTWTVDDTFETFSEATSSSYNNYSPSKYNPLDGTEYISGLLPDDLRSNDDVYMTFRSYGTNINNLEDFVDQISNIDSVADKGTHSNFTAMQAGPDSTYDNLTEADTGGTFGEAPDSGTSYVTTSANYMYLGVYTCSVSGAVTQVSFRGRGASGGYVKAVITDSSGRILENGVSDALSYPASTAYYTCVWSNNKPQVTAGNTYWIGIIASVNGRLYYYSTTGGTSKIDSSNSYSSPTNPTDASTGTRQWHRMQATVVNYQLDLEVQWTSADYDETNAYLCIYTGTLDSETLKVDVWNGAGWTNIISSLSASQWNNVSIGTYLTGTTITFRFLGGTETGDTSPSSWQIGCALLHTWSDVYTCEVEFTGTSNMESWSQLTWKIDSSFTTDNITATFQLYNYTAGRYSTGGDTYGYIIDTIGTTDKTETQTIPVNPTDFRNATSGEWKVKIKGVKAAPTPFDLKVDWIEIEVESQNTYSLSITGDFILDISPYSLTDIDSMEIQIRFRANDTFENWVLKAYNWRSGQYDEINEISATTNFENHTISLTKNYVNTSDGTLRVTFCDANPDANQTTIEIDFFGVQALISRPSFNFKNSGAITTHIIAIWVINQTNHERYDVDLFINAGEDLTYIPEDIRLPEGRFTVKIVTERGKIAVFTQD